MSSHEKWRKLFCKTEFQATVDMLEDPGGFVSRAEEIRELIEQYCWDHDQKSYEVGKEYEVYVMTEAHKLIGLLGSMVTRVNNPEIYLPEDRPLTTMKSLLLERYEAFREEGKQYVNPQQFPDIRALHAIKNQRRESLNFANAKREEKFAASRKQWQEWADAVWLDNPRWYKLAVAEEIKERHNIVQSVGWISNNLKKPKSD